MSQFHRTIAAVSPAGIHDPKKLQESIDLVETWGHKVICAPNHAQQHLYTAGTIGERVADLHWAIEHPEIDTIWFIRGGYGTAQLLPFLHESCHKPIIGFSDATALLAHGWHPKQRLQWPNLYHGPVLNSVSTLCDDTSKQHMRHWLNTGDCPTITATHAFGPAHTIEGPMVGGNLCVLASICGSETLPPRIFEGCILALEDISEPLYKIDRMLLQLQISGVLEGVKGILMGSFHNCNPPTSASYTLLDVFKERLLHLQFPVYVNAPFGHNEVNWIWKHGKTIRLHA